MLLFFQIFFIILSAICVAGTIPIGSFLGLTWVFVLILGAVLFYFLSMLCKNSRPKESANEDFDKKEDNE